MTKSFLENPQRRFFTTRKGFLENQTVVGEKPFPRVFQKPFNGFPQNEKPSFSVF
jgi:hypothetical protein